MQALEPNRPEPAKIGQGRLDFVKMRFKSPNEIRKMHVSNLVVAEMLDIFCLIAGTEAVIAEGDIIRIDLGTFKESDCGDSARTIPAEKIDDDSRKLIEVSRRSLELAAEQCYPGNHLDDVGYAAQQHLEKNGLPVVRDCVGYGIGRAMSEDPLVPNYAWLGTGKRLKSELVIVAEPVVNAGAPGVEVLTDKWTAVTRDGRRSAHFEHSIAITDKALGTEQRLF